MSKKNRTRIIFIALISWVGVTACASPDSVDAPDAKKITTVAPTFMMTGSGEYDPSSPAAPDEEAEIDDSELQYSSLAGGPLACPLRINQAMIPGTVSPFHTTYVGNVPYLLPRVQRLGSSPQGVPKARYSIPEAPGKWYSEDGQVRILRGTVDGYCWFRPTRLRVAVGALHVYEADVEWYDVNPPPPPDPCDNPETITVETECEPDGTPAGSGGNAGYTDEMSGPASGGSQWVCLVTDWYESANGGPWVYVETTVDYCWLEPV